VCDIDRHDARHETKIRHDKIAHNQDRAGLKKKRGRKDSRPDQYQNQANKTRIKDKRLGQNQKLRPTAKTRKKDNKIAGPISTKTTIKDKLVFAKG
jgi:hypothetical protein